MKTNTTILACATGLTLTLLTLGCIGASGEGEDNDENNGGGQVRACPYTFEDPETMFDVEGSPALLTFATFPEGELETVGADGTDFQYIVQSIQPFIDSDGRQDRTPTITYIQNTKGPFALFTPDEVAGEYDRLANNAEVTLGATSSNTTVDLGGVEANVLVSTADASKVMTVFVPVDEGAFFAPVSIGVYTGRAGCDATRDETFDRLLASIAPNADTTFNELDGIIEVKAQKSE